MGDEKEMLRESWEEHKAREKEGIVEKAVDKDRAKADDSYHSVTFDMQAVLTTPIAGDAHIYCKRKLSVYNFTIYDNSSANGHCYLWDETEGGRGANEIASILLSYFHNLPRSVRHFTSFSDTCAGQNRNQFVAAAMLHAVQQIDHLETIDLKYMESGHSYMEVDSMHATIENARTHQRIYTPREWQVVIRGARKRPHPYDVKVLKHTDFVDIKELAAKKINNRTRNTDGGIVNWLNIKWLRFEKSAPHTMQYKHRIQSEGFMKLVVSSERVRRRRPETTTLQQLYMRRLPISEEKKREPPEQPCDICRVQAILRRVTIIRGVAAIAEED